MIAASSALSRTVQKPSGLRMRAAAEVADFCQASPLWRAMACRSITPIARAGALRDAAVRFESQQRRGDACVLASASVLKRC